ncbi:hypothetical protein BN159_8459 [Streptomyces davaonensis JCM 4913]|uniref:Uncharacterized protein n=1 Tax=Streptomyces davaonensis (strain DSM 101723 / JCM 4913 / KCC S-0913 / 768) TaxID=1214101 RepID=K4RGH5_STRDJ|nr:hypothetical protein [Streptomyces davaonensis]CCK32837.1 hypothetical protein BN159_8459 [Streptomyces davaonensis JCM 4913]
MSTIDDLLAQSLLLHQPHVPSDVVPYNDLAEDDIQLWDGYRPQVADDRAAQSLTALCEAVVTHCTPDQFADFLTDQIPQPRAAWILGCVLQLAGADNGARFWWQYAAGADDAPASYCLYLHHLAQGDTHAATLWQAQADAHAPQDHDPDPGEDAPAYRMMTADTSLATVLRILSRLTRATQRRHTPTAQAVIEFVAAAVAIGYDRHPDLEIPVPGTHFAEQLEVIIAAASSMRDHTRTTTTPAEELPNRPAPIGPGERTRVPSTAQGPAHLLVEVTAADHEPASARVFFKGAAAVCWKAATAADTTDGHGSRMAYHLSRFRT